MNTSTRATSLTKHSTSGLTFSRVVRNVIVLLLISLTFPAMALPPEEEPAKNGVHWAKINYYKPLPGTMEPDTSSLPASSIFPNRLFEYNKEGWLMSNTEFKGGTDDVTNFTIRFFRDGPRPKKKVVENSKFDEVYATTFTYDAEGHEVSQQTKSGPGDNLHLGTDGSTESTWTGGRLVKVIRKNAKGAVEFEISYTYDGEGKKVREGYSPAGLYTGKSFAWDGKGNVSEETTYDKAGKPSSTFAFTYDSAGRVLKQTLTSLFEGKVQTVEITDNTYDPQGGRTSSIRTKDGKVTSSLSWKHTYDKKGSRIQTVHLKDGKPLHVEVRKLTYYQP